MRSPSHPTAPPRARPRLVDSTLREGEQFAFGHFSSRDRLDIARALDCFGVDVLELTSPAASPRSEADTRAIAAAGLRAQVVAHVRCHPDDIAAAADCGVDGVHVFLGTSQWLRDHGHGRSVAPMLDELEGILQPLQARGLVTRFSCEDAFRTPGPELVELCRQAADLGVDRVGLADTVGRATPDEVAAVVSRVREAVDCGIEFHGHNDGGCAIANTWAAWQAGATHLDVTVLGVGERNGIASLSGLVARMVLADPALCADFDLHRLMDLDELVADRLGIEVPFNAAITAPAAFTHKAGLHAAAVLSDPRAYEAFDPATFARRRELLVGHHLTGRHALGARAEELSLVLSPETLAAVAAQVKALADDGPLQPTQVDTLLRLAAQPAVETTS